MPVIECDNKLARFRNQCLDGSDVVQQRALPDYAPFSVGPKLFKNYVGIILTTQLLSGRFFSVNLVREIGKRVFDLSGGYYYAYCLVG